MKYYYALYMSDDLISKREQILRKIQQDKWQLGKYLIVLPSNASNQLEFYSSVILLQDAMTKDDLFVVGIASGYDEAVKLVKKITEDVYEETQTADIRNYLLDKQREYEKGNV